MEWTSEQVLAAARVTLSGYRPHSPWVFERAELDGDQLLVVFRVDPPWWRGSENRFGVYYSIAGQPYGLSTGMQCPTPEEWTIEIDLLMEEQILTGGLPRAERDPGPDGLVLLRWVW